MLDNNQIGKNRENFIALLKRIDRDGAEIDRLIAKLDSSDFFFAPATAMYNNAYEGGLCEHSLQVYSIMAKIIDSLYLNEKIEQREDEIDEEYNERVTSLINSGCTVTMGNYLYKINPNRPFDNSILITALLHDVSKMNFYEETVINKKYYSKFGKKQDELGKFDWVSEKGYKVKSVDERFVFGTKGQNSAYIIGYYIPLTLEETAAITQGTSTETMDAFGSANLSEIMAKYPLATLLHSADMIATYNLQHRDEEDYE